MSRNLLLHSIKRLPVLSLICFFAVLNLHATSAKCQDVKSLTLKETIDLPLKNSNILKASKARNDEAAAQLRQALDNRLPNGSVSGSYLYMANP